MSNAFLDLADYGADQVREWVRLARHLEKDWSEKPLSGKSMGLLFMNPSLRTLMSMQVAIEHLGGFSSVIQPGQASWSLEFERGAVMDSDKVEHVKEAIPVLAQYFDYLGVRSFAGGKCLETDLADQKIQQMASLFGAPFMSLESGAAHPCQALADRKTLDDRKIPEQGKFVLSWAYHPKPLPYAVPYSAIAMALQRGMEVTVLRPEGYDLPQSLLERLSRWGSVQETNNRQEAMKGAHVLYCKSWAKASCYGEPETDIAYRSQFKGWCVDEDWFAGSAEDSIFMHCLPVRRNVKVTDAVLDGPRSVVVQQAGNRLSAQKAVLFSMSQGEMFN